MNYYPVFLNLSQKPCLVVGAGQVALGKINHLLEAGAALTVVAPEVHPELAVNHPQLTLVWRAFQKSDLDDMFLVIAATDNAALNHEIHRQGEARGMLVNVVDDTPHCNFILPSIARQGPLTVAVSSSGTSPTLARRLREHIEKHLLTPDLARLAEFLGSWRTRIHPHLPTFPLKKAFWQRVMASRLPHFVSQRRQGARALLQTLLNEVRLSAGHEPVVLANLQGSAVVLDAQASDAQASRRSA